ncbi:hypothetical protein RCC89_04255 [Cytophagaceae bacterium ABcell3]|nr:hypothetical protein RCC89_04255 [Cytophagaceae bacterium ABcell3]
MVRALLDFGFTEKEAQPIKELNFTDYIVFSIGKEPKKSRLLNPVKAQTGKRLLLRSTLNIPIIHNNDLILSKFNTGKDKDKAGIEELKKKEKS